LQYASIIKYPADEAPAGAETGATPSGTHGELYTRHIPKGGFMAICSECGENRTVDSLHDKCSDCYDREPMVARCQPEEIEEVIVTSSITKRTPMRFDLHLEDLGDQETPKKPYLANACWLECLLAIADHSHTSFAVCEAGNPANVVLRGSCEKSLSSLAKGERGSIIGFSSTRKVSELREAVRKVGY
jgi:hypothetical protein